MLSSIEGIYRHGMIELLETHAEINDDTYVIVTFLQSGPVNNLKARGLDARHAADLRHRLAAFAEEWESPEMAIYDDYDSAKSKL